ncbi:polynucleotide kinase 3 phosphatase-domain-containing protein [Mycena crocata]|nr:polynucleotide kinase 3 phosphatase-domain-containing protein [Mycena crocata]
MSSSPSSTMIHQQRKTRENASTRQSKCQYHSTETPTLQSTPVVHPFLSKSPATAESSTSSSLSWLKSPGGAASCLYAVNLSPRSSPKAPPEKWDWWNAVVPAKLAAVASEGYAVGFFSKQSGLKSVSKEKEWKMKIALIAAAIPGVPFRLFAATAKDNYRKPMTGMWQELESLFIDKKASFYVGDAAGRQYPNSTLAEDLDSSDRKFALNLILGIPFQTPEVGFVKKNQRYSFTATHPTGILPWEGTRS